MYKPDFNRLRKVLLRLGEPDILPFYEVYVDDEILHAATKIKSYPENLVAFYDQSGFDCLPVFIGIGYPLPELVSKDTASLSKGTRYFMDENHGMIETRKDFDKYGWPDVTPEIIHDLQKAIAIMPDGMKAIPGFRSVFENISFLMGLVPLSYAIYEDTQLLWDITEKLGKDMIALIQLCLDNLDMNKVGAFALCDDMGYLSGTIVAPEWLRKYIFPWEKKAVSLLHDHDMPVILHACGNLTEVMDDLIDDVGFDAKHSFEDKIMDICEAKKRYGNRIALLGGVDMNILCTAEEEQLREYVRNIIHGCAPGGGFALGTGNSVANYVPLQNYRIMLEEGRKSY